MIMVGYLAALDQFLFAFLALPAGASFSPILLTPARLTPPALTFVRSGPPSRNRRLSSSTSATLSTRSCPLPLAAMPASEQERLLLTEPAQTAFVAAEMRSFLTSALERNDSPAGHLTRWELSPEDRVARGLSDANGTVTSREYLDAARSMAGSGGALAIDLLCNATANTFKDGFNNQPGLLSALGSAIIYFREAFRTPANLAACERVGVSDYAVAHHITDMYHHRNFRGAYTKTLLPSGSGEIASRAAVGLAPEGSDRNSPGEDEDADEEDECVLWSPTTPGVCIHWKSDNEAWRKKRFEKIQMEGTKDPRRGGSGTTR